MNPLVKAVLPFRLGKTKLGIGGHDVAPTQWKAQRIECLIHVPCQGQQYAPRLGRTHTYRRSKKNAVVLIGRKGLLHAPFAAEGEPHKADAIQRGIFHRQFERALGDAVV